MLDIIYVYIYIFKYIYVYFKNLHENYIDMLYSYTYGWRRAKLTQISPEIGP